MRITRRGVTIGRWTLYWWSGSWNRPGPEECYPECCSWNYYVGPFGLEVDGSER